MNIVYRKINLNLICEPKSFRSLERFDCHESFDHLEDLESLKKFEILLSYSLSTFHFY